jgi:hypothetical protein
MTDKRRKPRYRPTLGKHDMDGVRQTFKKRQNILSLFEGTQTCLYI